MADGTVTLNVGARNARGEVGEHLKKALPKMAADFGATVVTVSDNNGELVFHVHFADTDVPKAERFKRTLERSGGVSVEFVRAHSEAKPEPKCEG